MTGHCAMCGLPIPATPAPPPHDGLVELGPHERPQGLLTVRCIGSGMHVEATHGSDV
jgi:hypothetical protein